MKPPFTYFGGKGRLAGKIAALLPECGHYVEPFCGSLAVLLARKPSAMETVNDLDHAIQAFWRVLRERPAELERACALTPHSLAEFTEAGDFEGPAGELEQARRVWIRLTQGRSGQLKPTGWRHYVDPAASTYGMPAYLAAYTGRMGVAAARLHHVSLECRPALDVIRWYGRSPNVLLFTDPPYLGTTRTSGGYRHEMTGEDDHRELAKALHEVKAAVVLAGYASELYDLELYPDWHRTELETGTGQGSGQWSNRTEVLWSNRPFPAAQSSLFDLAGEAS